MTSLILTAQPHSFYDLHPSSSRARLARAVPVVSHVCAAPIQPFVVQVDARQRQTCPEFEPARSLPSSPVQCRIDSHSGARAAMCIRVEAVLGYTLKSLDTRLPVSPSVSFASTSVSAMTAPLHKRQRAIAPLSSQPSIRSEMPAQRLTVDDIPEECLELIFQRLALSVSRSNSLESPSPVRRRFPCIFYTLTSLSRLAPRLT